MARAVESQPNSEVASMREFQRAAVRLHILHHADECRIFLSMLGIGPAKHDS
jgi:hypothetical protein